MNGVIIIDEPCTMPTQQQKEKDKIFKAIIKKRIGGDSPTVIVISRVSVGTRNEQDR